MTDLDFQKFEFQKKYYVLEAFGVVTKIGNDGSDQSRRFFSDFLIFRNRQDPWKYIQFTIGFTIVNYPDFDGS